MVKLGHVDHDQVRFFGAMLCLQEVTMASCSHEPRELSNLVIMLVATALEGGATCFPECFA